jgi:hypothetical protein
MTTVAFKEFNVLYAESTNTVIYPQEVSLTNRLVWYSGCMDSDGDAEGAGAGEGSEGAAGDMPAEGLKKGESSGVLPRTRSMDKIFFFVVGVCTVAFLLFVFLIQL